MEMDPASLNRIKTFMQLIQRAGKAGIKPTFVSTPTEHGDNINAVALIEGKRDNAGLLFWDVTLLQDHGLVDRLDEEELALVLIRYKEKYDMEAQGEDAAQAWLFRLDRR